MQLSPAGYGPGWPTDWNVPSERPLLSNTTHWQPAEEHFNIHDFRQACSLFVCLRSRERQQNAIVLFTSWDNHWPIKERKNVVNNNPSWSAELIYNGLHRWQKNRSLDQSLKLSTWHWKWMQSEQHGLFMSNMLSTDCIVLWTIESLINIPLSTWYELSNAMQGSGADREDKQSTNSQVVIECVHSHWNCSFCNLRLAIHSIIRTTNAHTAALQMSLYHYSKRWIGKPMCIEWRDNLGDYVAND